MNKPAQRPSVEFTLTVLNGPDKGSTYRLMSEKVTLGRDADNDIIISKDPKCSRHHAVIAFSPKGIKIFDVTNKNKILVDGSKGKVRPLRDKSVLEVGQTKFQFRVHETGGKNLAVQGANPLSAQGMGGSPEMPSQSPRWSKGSAKKKGPDFGLIIGVVLLVVVGFFLSSKSDKSNTIDIVTQEDTDNRLALEIKEDQVLQDRKIAAGINTAEYRSAKTLYLQGFRDYQKGQYARSFDSFVACLTAFPTHALCMKYKSLSMKKLKELIQYNMVLGRRYKDQNQFQACVSAFNNVVVMASKNNDREVVREAKQTRSSCMKRLETIY